MQQVNQESQGVVIPPVGISRKGTQETTLSTFPDKNFSIRTKDDGSWPSLNFKLKNTVGYIFRYWKIPSARAPEISSPRDVFYAARQKSDFRIFCARTAAHVHWIRVLNI